MRPRCWRSDFLRARCKYCARCKLPNASLILCCVIGVSLIQLQRQKPKHTWLANSLLPDYQILLTIQPKATPTQTTAITTDSDFNLCTCTFRSHNPSTALSIFSFNASTSCFISKMQSSEPPPWPPQLGGITFFQRAGSSPGLRKYAAYCASDMMMLHVVGSSYIYGIEL